jgi:hypothetical protein
MSQSHRRPGAVRRSRAAGARTHSQMQMGFAFFTLDSKSMRRPKTRDEQIF